MQVCITITVALLVTSLVVVSLQHCKPSLCNCRSPPSTHSRFPHSAAFSAAGNETSKSSIQRLSPPVSTNIPLTSESNRQVIMILPYVPDPHRSHRKEGESRELSARGGSIQSPQMLAHNQDNPTMSCSRDTWLETLWGCSVIAA